MTLKGNDVLINGTIVRSLSNKAHHLVDVGHVGIVMSYLPTLSMYKVKYNVAGRKVIRVIVYREEFEVITDDD